MKILIIDDSKIFRNILINTLKSGGYEDIEFATDGTEGLEKIKQEQFDLIISDINMPQMNGIEMVKEIRKLQNYKDTPILISSTETNEIIKKEAKSAGVTSWITKPFTPEKFLKVIDIMFKNKG